jgi:hypothetical protein
LAVRADWRVSAANGSLNSEYGGKHMDFTARAVTLGCSVGIQAAIVLMLGSTAAGHAVAAGLGEQELLDWQVVSEREELVGDGRHHADVVLRDRIAKIGDGEIVLQQEQHMHVPDEDPVPTRPAGMTRDGSERITATAKIADIDIYHIDAVRNKDLPPDDRVRGAGRGRFLVLPCRDNAKCWTLSAVDSTDSDPGKPSNQHVEKIAAQTLTRDNVPTYWADGDSADQARDSLKARLYKDAGIDPPAQ